MEVIPTLTLPKLFNRIGASQLQSMNKTLEQCVQRHKKHSMIIHRDKIDE